MQYHEWEIEAEQEERNKTTIADLNPGDRVAVTLRTLNYDNDGKLTDTPVNADAIVTDTGAGGRVLTFEDIEFISGPWEDTRHVLTYAQKPAVLQAYYPERDAPTSLVHLAVVEDINVVGTEPDHEEVVA